MLSNTKPIKINLSCASGVPSNPRTWSGTTNNFLQELKKKGSLNTDFESKINNKLFNFLNNLLGRYYSTIKKRQGIGLLGWPLMRYFKSASNIYLTRKSKSSHTLHFGTLDLPFIVKPTSQTHYLYTDGSWNLWSKFDTQNTHSDHLISEINKLEKKSYEQVAHIFTTSEYVKQDLINYYKIAPEKLTVVGTGTGIIQPFYGSKEYNNRKILFVAKGRFTDKGGDLVLETFKRLVERNPAYQLSIVGQSDYTNINHPNIHTYGFIPINELQDLFNTHSLFLMPAINEPWGLVYIEAMLCKMPIIGLNRNSFPELSGYGKWGVGIENPDPEQLVEIIENIFGDLDKMEAMGNEAQKFALKNFLWSLTVEKVLENILQKQS